MQDSHTLYYMQTSQDSVDRGPSRQLLTALEVQDLLQIDRSTVYRMAEDGRLPSIRVGRTWRFPAQAIHELIGGAPELSTPGVGQPGPPERTISIPAEATGAALPAIAQATIDVAADLLGVMMVATDMHGAPITSVANPCPWFTEHRDDPGVLQACISEWSALAAAPDLTPAFQLGQVGFECARAFIRDGTSLVGMVLAGGISPAGEATMDAELYHLDAAARARVLAALPRIAAAISTQATR